MQISQPIFMLVFFVEKAMIVFFSSDNFWELLGFW